MCACTISSIIDSYIDFLDFQRPIIFIMFHCVPLSRPVPYPVPSRPVSVPRAVLARVLDEGPPRPGGSLGLPHWGLTHPAREIFQKFFCKIVELLHLRQRTILSVKIRLSFSTSYAARCPQPIIFCLKNLGKTALQGGFPLEFTVWWSWVITLHDTHEYPPYSPMSTLCITGEYPHL